MDKTQLSMNEINDLDRLERVVEDNMVSWMKVGFALREIRDRKLYRMSHATFEQYTKERFDCARSTAYQLITGVEVIENVRNADKTCPVLPEKESLARPLAKLEPEEQAKAWDMAINRAKESGADVVMSKHVVWAVDLLRGNPQPRTRNMIENSIGTLPDIFKKAFEDLIQSIRDARKNRFEGVDRKKMIKIIDGLKRLLEG